MYKYQRRAVTPVESMLFGFVLVLVVGVVLATIIAYNPYSRTGISTTTQPSVKSVATQPTAVVAKTWTWAKLVSKPVPISGFDGGELMQVEFRVPDSETLTALVCIADETTIGKRLVFWEVGDEVSIARIFGKGHSNSPETVYIVVDWRRVAASTPAK